MINVGIYDGDILIVERQNTARNGDTVVAMNSDNEATVKTFYKEDGYFRLQPENDTMEPIILKEVTILGKSSWSISEIIKESKITWILLIFVELQREAIKIPALLGTKALDAIT